MCLGSPPPLSNMAPIKKKKKAKPPPLPKLWDLMLCLFFIPPLTCLQIHSAKSKGKKQNDTEYSIIPTLPLTLFTLCHNLTII